MNNPSKISPSQLKPSKNSWDIFCKVVDNFGDVGVCWRLSKQLAHEYGLQVRLMVDDLNVAAKLLPNLDSQLSSQTIAGVEICLWPGDEQAFTHTKPAQVVIEAFACELPSTYVQNMLKTKPIWLNLEYLSAEKWVDEFHAQHSIHAATGLKKTFFFPGFTEKTGGLIREQHLTQKREALTAKPAVFWDKLNLRPSHHSLKVSLFCYPHAPIQSLLNTMAHGSQPTHCFVPNTAAVDLIAQYFGQDHLSIGTTVTHQRLSLTVLPFLSQDDYDQLLWACDLNFVRGEDSWIRALWSAQPLIWQTYQQDENLHITKQAAFLEVYAEKSGVLSAFNQAWLSHEIKPALWQNLCASMPALKIHAQKRCFEFEKQADLAAKLVIFTKN